MLSFTRLLILGVLYGCTFSKVSKTCVKTFKAYGREDKVVHVRAKPPNKSQVCSMFAESCCSVATEYRMRERAENGFRELALELIHLRVKRIETFLADTFLIPIVFNEEFNDLVKKDGPEPTLTYQELALTATRLFIQESCMGYRTTETLVKRLVPSIKRVSDRLLTLYTGLNAIKKALEIAAQTEFSPDCTTAVMKNGLYSGKDFAMEMCQACIRDTILLQPCSNTCRNVARGCLSDLTEMSLLVNELADRLDKHRSRLTSDVEPIFEILDELEADNTFATFPPECLTGAKFQFNLKNDPSSAFTEKPLMLKDVFALSADYACLLSENIVKECWTAEGITPLDSSNVVPFTTQEQSENNPSLPRTGVTNTSLLEGEELLRVATRLADKLDKGEDIFTMDTYPEAPATTGTFPETPDPTEKIKVTTKTPSTKGNISQVTTQRYETYPPDNIVLDTESEKSELDKKDTTPGDPDGRKTETNREIDRTESDTENNANMEESDPKKDPKDSDSKNNEFDFATPTTVEPTTPWATENPKTVGKQSRVHLSRTKKLNNNNILVVIYVVFAYILS